MSQSTLDTLATDCDVVVMGGGIAGLTLALQIVRARPDTRIVVAENRQHPVPEAAHKVGESSVEIQAHYLREVLGLRAHLETEQLDKFGLRMFFSHGANDDISRRVEYGQVFPAPLDSYQLDRGRLENMLGRLVGEHGVSFLSDCQVAQVELRGDQDTHAVRLRQGDVEREVTARWVVDASGRRSLLKRQLGLQKSVGHRANAAWFRIAQPLDVDDWSQDPQWRQRVPGRRLSTNHLMGEGYWVWLIPLASGSTSVGIVAEDSLHDVQGFNTFDRALAWLHAREPQCASAVQEHLDDVQDFRVLRDYAYSATQVYSPDRWCLTGEAGVSIDPLYSSGGDLMAISNGMITDLVTRDLAGEDVRQRAVGHNQVYLVLSDVWLVAYDQQYPLMGNPQVMVAKVVWDTIIYWGFPGLLYFHDKLPPDSSASLANLYRCWKLHGRVQRFFREWHALDNPSASEVFADPYTLLDLIVDLHNGMAAGLDDEALDAQFERNARLLEQLAGQLVRTVSGRLSSRAEEEPVARQLQDWEQDKQLQQVLRVYDEDQLSNPVDDTWVTLGHQSADAVGAGR